MNSPFSIASQAPLDLQFGTCSMGNLEELLTRVARSDTEALSELYDRLAGIVHALALRIVQDSTLAENTVQKVFLTVWHKAHMYDSSRASVRTWILSIARNHSVDEWRRQQRRMESRDLDQLSLADPVNGNNPLSRAIQDERSALVREALDSLPQDQKQALLLAYFSGLSHTQIARHLEAPLGTVKTRIQLGMDKLRRKLRPRFVQ